jgi:hypothetical protein
MLYDLLYTIAAPLVIASVSISSCYLLFPQQFKSTLIGLSWNASSFYIECSEMLKSKNDTQESDSGSEGSESEPDEDDVMDSFLFYNKNLKQTFLTKGVIKSKCETIRNNEDVKVMFLNRVNGSKEQYQRVENLDKLEDLESSEFKTLEKQFIQVEYITKKEESEEIVDIHSNLNNFYVDGNIILDKEFLEWYLDYFYNLPLTEEYKLRIFDKDVNMFNILPKNGILFSNNTYTTVEMDDFSFNETPEVYEGAEEE